jgi:hypothetical protein
MQFSPAVTFTNSTHIGNFQSSKLGTGNEFVYYQLVMTAGVSGQYSEMRRCFKFQLREIQFTTVLVSAMWLCMGDKVRCRTIVLDARI